MAFILVSDLALQYWLIFPRSERARINTGLIDALTGVDQKVLGFTGLRAELCETVAMIPSRTIQEQRTQRSVNRGGRIRTKVSRNLRRVAYDLAGQ